MAKLLVHTRDTIEERLLRNRFGPVVHSLATDYAALAVEVYNTVYPRAARDRMEALPAGWLSEVPGFMVRFGETGNRVETLNFDGRQNIYRDLARASDDKLMKDLPQVLRRIPYKDKGSVVAVFAEDDRHARIHAELTERLQTLAVQISTTRKEARTALDSFSSEASLLKGWPEVAPFMPKYVPAPNLPALPRERLNAVLGLPLKEAA